MVHRPKRGRKAEAVAEAMPSMNARDERVREDRAGYPWPYYYIPIDFHISKIAPHWTTLQKKNLSKGGWPGN